MQKGWKPKRLQLEVLAHLEEGPSVTRWQRVRLNSVVMGRAIAKKDFRVIWFQVKGILRALFQRNR